MRILVALLCSQVVLCLASALPHVGRTVEGTLTIQERQKRGADARIVAMFRSTDGDGIKFRTSRNSLVLTTADEQMTLVNVSEVSVAIQSYGESGSATYFQIMDDAFISSNDRVYRIQNSNTYKATVNSYPFTHRDLLAGVQGEMLDDPQTAIQTSARRLVAHPAMRLLEPAARALGEDLGVTGSEEPASMLFFATAMRLSELYEESERYSSSARFSRHTSAAVQFSDLIAAAQEELECLKTCPPCPDLECLGLCGRRCSCWWWTCGDCCVHQGCLLHDKCCKQHGFYSVECLFPIGLSCNSYNC